LRVDINTSPSRPSRTNTPAKPAVPVQVSAEWGALKECVYGWPNQFILPRFLSDANARAYDEFERFWQENQERNVADADPDYYEAWQTQINDAVSLLRDLGIVVHQPTFLSNANLKFPRGENHGSMTGWLRDPFVTIANNVIELAPRSLFHRRQRFSIRHILAATMERGARYFAQPDPGADDSNDGPGWGYLEGGDIFVLNETILVGHSGHCSNPEGARWLQHVLGTDFDVQVVDIDPLFPHLDCVFMTPREGLLVVAEDAFLRGLPDCVRGWDRINVPVQAAKKYMACNNLVLDSRSVLMPADAHHDFVAAELAKRSIETLRLPYDAVYRVGGSFRCAHQPLVRI